ncbi:MAG: GNAT family N-acetyltransferase [Anaerolineales bacterium]|nr:GNAT family N-acetyltransferase [Anaerolineales bacterium]
METYYTVDPRHLPDLKPHFQDYTWNYLPLAMLEGQFGEVLVDDRQAPESVILQIPLLRLNILGGRADIPAARTFVENALSYSSFFTASQAWRNLLQASHPMRLQEILRYACSSESLRRERLEAFQHQVPPGYQVQALDMELAGRLAQEDSEFAIDHFLTYRTPEELLFNGFGFCALNNDALVCVATSFAVCDQGIEIQINTRPAHRRKGLATSVAAHLILFALEQGLDPNWDAANPESVALAQKLGYTYQGSYPIYLLPE